MDGPSGHPPVQKNHVVSGPRNISGSGALGGRLAVVYEHGRALISCDAPLWAAQQERKGLAFDFADKEWEPQWLFLRQPDPSMYERGGGRLPAAPGTGIL